MTGLDLSTLHWLNQFAERWPALDAAAAWAVDSNLLKGEAFMAVTWWLWFAAGERQARRRQILIATLAAAVLAVIAGRVLTGSGAFEGVLPFRLRPLADPRVGFLPPSALDPGVAERRAWSSFPSDHAMVFSALSTGLAYVSWRLGLLAHGYWLLVVALPRLYAGLHYPTDILGGAVIGALVAVALNTATVRRVVASAPLRALERWPRAFYAGFFLFTVQLALMFQEARALLTLLAKSWTGA